MTSANENAADLAAHTAWLEIADNVGLSALLDGNSPFTIGEAVGLGRVPKAAASSLLMGLVAAGLLERDGDLFVPCFDMAQRRYEAGYVSWALTANRPYLDHAEKYLRDPDAVAGRFERDGRSVAISSRWIGSGGFYPDQCAALLAGRPRRIVDLGSGAGQLLIQLLTALPNATGLALDMSAEACETAEEAAKEASVADRLTVVNRPIQSLLGDPEPVRGASVVHAGFVLHDVADDPVILHGILRACHDGLSDGGRLVVTDAVPYAQDRRERAFSALFTYLHATSMGVRLLSEDEWRVAFEAAGFGEVTMTPLPMPGSRLFIATR